MELLVFSKLHFRTCESILIFFVFFLVLSLSFLSCRCHSCLYISRTHTHAPPNDTFFMDSNTLMSVWLQESSAAHKPYTYIYSWNMVALVPVNKKIYCSNCFVHIVGGNAHKWKCRSARQFINATENAYSVFSLLPAATLPELLLHRSRYIILNGQFVRYNKNS